MPQDCAGLVNRFTGMSPLVGQRLRLKTVFGAFWLNYLRGTTHTVYAGKKQLAQERKTHVAAFNFTGFMKTANVR